MYRSAAVTALFVVFPQSAWADGGRLEPGDWWRAWRWDPLIVLSLAVLAWLYGRGLMRLSAKVGAGNKVRLWQAACYFGALATLGLALLSPLDTLSEELSSAHMVQHMLLSTVSALLLILGAPTFVLAWGLPEATQGWGRSFWLFVFRLPQEPCLWHPWFTWVLFAGTLWAWHHPVLYQSALRDPLLHDAQHLSFFVAACLYWRVCIDPIGGPRLSAPGAIPYLFTTSLHSMALGVFLALSPQAWYGDYAERTSGWGLTPLEDQQLAGLIMWMPACLIFPGVAAVRFGAWLSNHGGVTPNRPHAAEGAHAWCHR